MAFPDMFSDDAQTERLASYFEELYEYLLEMGVPEECLPSPWHVLRRVTKAIDHDLLREWLDAYASVESEADEDDDEEDDEGEQRSSEAVRQRSRTRVRPSYLRALDDATQEDADQDDVPEDGS
jgi:hypothetical protein